MAKRHERPTMKKIWDIHGGIHPPENKSQSLSKAIVTAPIAPQLTLPLSQHIGAPAKAIVNIGDSVLKGQCIAEAVGPVSVPLHAPTSGTIVAIEERTIPHPSGLEDSCIVIEPNGDDEWRERNPITDVSLLDKNILQSQTRLYILEIVRGQSFQEKYLYQLQCLNFLIMRFF